MPAPTKKKSKSAPGTPRTAHVTAGTSLDDAAVNARPQRSSSSSSTDGKPRHRRKNSKRIKVKRTGQQFAHLLSADDRKERKDWWKICCIYLGIFVYIVGFAALAYYAFIVGNAAPYFSPSKQLQPILAHIVGMSSMCVVKVHFDLSPAVGHIEQSRATPILNP